MRKSSTRIGLIIGGVGLAMVLALGVILIVVAGFSFWRYGGVQPAYMTLSSGYWSGFTQTAAAPAQMTQQVYYNMTSTAGVPASLTADVDWRQTSTAGAVPSMTAQALWEQNAPATATAAAIATQAAAP